MYHVSCLILLLISHRIMFSRRRHAEIRNNVPSFTENTKRWCNQFKICHLRATFCQCKKISSLFFTYSPTCASFLPIPNLNCHDDWRLVWKDALAAKRTIFRRHLFNEVMTSHGRIHIPLFISFLPLQGPAKNASTVSTCRVWHSISLLKTLKPSLQ